VTNRVASGTYQPNQSPNKSGGEQKRARGIWWGTEVRAGFKNRLNCLKFGTVLLKIGNNFLKNCAVHIKISIILLKIGTVHQNRLDPIFFSPPNI
jgi:hypothetical protein